MTQESETPCPATTINCCKSYLPQGSEKVLFAVSTYATLLSIIDQASSKEAVKDSNNETLFTVNDEIVNVTVARVSNAVLWNCRDSSMTSTFYKHFYTAVVVCLFIYVFIFMTRITKKWIKCECNKYDWAPLISSICIRFSLIFIVTSYDISPFACIAGPSSISYNDQTVTLTFNEHALNYQKAAPIVSLVIGIVGWIITIVISIFRQCCKCCISPDEEEIKYTVTYKEDFTLNISNKKMQTMDITKKVDTENYIKMFVL